MAEKESIKVSLGTTICIFIIILLIVALGVVYYLGFIKNNEKINELENKQIALEEALEEARTVENDNKNIVNETEEKAEEQTNKGVINNNADLDIIYVKKLGKNGTLMLPQINSDSEGAKSINEKINKLCDINEIHGVISTTICTESIGYKGKNLVGIRMYASERNRVLFLL